MPQGSILGPLLFLLYVNDITKCGISGNLQLYADDTVIYYHSTSLSDLESQMNVDVSILANWLRINKLSLNIKKTHYLTFGNKDYVPMNITLGTEKLQNIEVTKYLGLLIDSKLSWNSHVDHVKSKISPITGVLYRLQGLLSTSLLRATYYAMIHSHLSYLVSIWGTITKKQISEIQVIQNRAIRNIYRLPWDTHIKDIYLKTNILPFTVLPKYNITCTILQIIHRSSHTNIKPAFNSDIHQHKTRSQNQIHLASSTHTTKFGINSLQYIAYRQYNALPNEIKQPVTNKKILVKTLKDYFLKMFLNQ